MTDVWARKTAEDTFTIISAKDQKACAGIPVGQTVKLSIKRRRSSEHHRMFFGVIAAATHHWPDGHECDPDGDPEKLRAWLLMKAGYCNQRPFRLREAPIKAEVTAFAALVAQAAIQAGDHAAIRVDESTVRLYWPKSIAWDKLDQKEFAPIADMVFALIESETKMKIADLMKTDDAAEEMA